MKPPAFQFYAADFLVGTADLTCEQVGAYIRLLCHQWDRGFVPLDIKVVARICAARPSRLAPVLSKFDRTEEGYRNARLESERVKQKEFREKQAVHGRRRWGNAKPQGLAEGTLPKPSCQTDALQSSSSSTDFSHREKKERASGWPKDEGEVKTGAATAGIHPEFALMAWNEAEGRGGSDGYGNPILAFWPYVKGRWGREQSSWREQNARGVAARAQNGPFGKVVRPATTKEEYDRGF